MSESAEEYYYEWMPEHYDGEFRIYIEDACKFAEAHHKHKTQKALEGMEKEKKENMEIYKNDPSNDIVAGINMGLSMAIKILKDGH